MLPPFSGTAAPASWSVSRDQVLQTCERKYYFQYLAGGRLNGVTPRQRQVGLLKKLKTVPMWLGDCFHHAVAEYVQALRDGRVLTRAEVVGAMRARVERDWRFSAAGRYRQQPYAIDKSGAALLEHHYGTMSPENSANSSATKVEAWLDTFLNWAESGTLQAELMAADRVWVEPAAWGVEAPGFLEGDVQIVTKVDLAWERAGEAFVIYDWKASEAPRLRPLFLSQHELQVGVYQLWPHLTFGVDLDRICSRLVYCGGGQATVEEHKLDPETLPLVRTALRDSVRLAERWADRFTVGDLTPDQLNYAGTVAACRQCGFRELCRSDSNP